MLRLFCFPYGGGGVNVFRHWAEALPRFVEVCSVELPGHDSLIGQPPLLEFPRLICALESAIKQHLDLPFVFFGHSLGALVGFELARQLRRQECPRPSVLVVSGHPAPHVPSNRPTLHNLPREAFIEAVRQLQGTPIEVLQHVELMNLVIPPLRADFQLHEAYEYVDEDPLDMPVVAFAGKDDPEAKPLKVASWRRHTTSHFAMHLFSGGHFFLKTGELDVLRKLGEILALLLTATETNRARVRS